MTALGTIALGKVALGTVAFGMAALGTMHARSFEMELPSALIRTNSGFVKWEKHIHKQ